MKILFLISRFLDGGIDTVLVEYLNALCSLTEHEVTLAIGLKMNEAEVFLSRIDKKVRVEYLVDQDWLTSYKRKKHHHQENALLGAFDEICLNPLRRLQMHNRLRKLSKDMDVVIDFDACFGSFMLDIPSKVRKIMWFHFSIKTESERAPKRILRLEKRFERYDRIVLISDAMLEEAVTFIPQYKDRYCRIYNCINKEVAFAKSVADCDTGKEPYLLAVERLEESQKDITSLVKAYSVLKKKKPDAPLLYIIGEGKSRGEIEELIDRLNLGDYIRLLGFVSNPYPWIRNAEMVVHSSKFEGLPTVLIEALILGKVIISSDCPTGPDEILSHGESGVLVPVGDYMAFAEAVLKVLDDTEVKNRILPNAAKHSMNFLPDNSIRELERIICEAKG